jgi:hypothetical protein
MAAYPAAVQRDRVERSETGVKAPSFSCVVAQSVAHAVQLLHQHGDEARILAGGQSLMLAHGHAAVDARAVAATCARRSSCWPAAAG